MGTIQRSLVPAGLAILGLLVSGRAEAQRFSLGARIGDAGAEVMFEDPFSDHRVLSEDKKMRFGGVAAYRLTPVLSLQLEALVSRKGWTEFTGGGRSITYLELPLLIGIHVPWVVSPHVLAGPFVSLETACTVTGVASMGEMSCDEPQTAWDRRKFDFGYWLGIGIGGKVGPGSLSLDYRNNVGLLDLNRDVLPRGYLRFETEAVSVAYTIPVGGE